MKAKETFFSSDRNPWYLTVLFFILMFTINKVSQLLIGSQAPPQGTIIDKLQILTSPINQYFLVHNNAARAVLITTSCWFDFSVIFLSLRALCGSSIRPALALFLFMIYRQTLQLLVSLPIPHDIIWFHPRFPSFFVDYSLLNDLYFSAHTGVSLLCALEFARFGKWWLTTIGFVFFAYLVSTIICFRFHYTMDVFTGALVALYVTYRANRIGPVIDQFFRAIDKKARNFL